MGCCASRPPRAGASPPRPVAEPDARPKDRDEIVTNSTSEAPAGSASLSRSPSAVIDRLAPKQARFEFLRDADLLEASYMPGTREWLDEDIRKWVMQEEQGDEGGARVLLLLGPAGVGKTAYAAHAASLLEEEGRLLGGHFFRARDATRTDPATVARALACQAAAAVPGAAAAFDRALSELEAGPDGGLSQPASAWFSRLVADPLREVPRPAVPRMLVLDALDEAAEAAVLQAVALCVRRLPGWVRVLATARPGGRVDRALELLRVRVVDLGGERAHEDVRAFVRGSLRTRGLSDEQREAAVEAVASQSGGSFAYVAAMLSMVRREMREGGGPASARGLADTAVGALPPGEAGLFTGYLNREAQRLGEADREAMLERLLPALAVAAGPLHRWEAEALAGSARAVTAVAELFPTDAEGLVRPFHESVADWLVNGAPPPWRVDPAQGHAAHVRAWAPFLEHMDGGGGATLGPYAAAHLVNHAVRGGALDLAARACASRGFLRVALAVCPASHVVGEVVEASRALHEAGHAGSRGAVEAAEWLRAAVATLAKDPTLAVGTVVQGTAGGAN